jgi:peptidyl-prolyl cis-trans isomerase D
MLDAMRRGAGSWIAKILFGILILSFAVWGIGDMFRGQGVSDNAAEIGDVAVTRDDLARQFRREIERLQRVMGPEFDSERARDMGLLDRTLETLIEGHLLGQKAHDIGLVASDDLVRRRIYAEPAFQNSARQFDTFAFRRALSEAGLSEAGYISMLKSGLLRGQLTDAISSGAEIPDLMRDTIHRYRGEKRITEYVLVPSASIAQVPEPTQDDLAAFHAQNQALFTSPELREITIISLDPEMAAQEVKPSEEQIKQAFEERLPSLSIPERRRVRQMLFAEEAAARQAHEALEKGRAFDEVAKETPGQAPVDLGLVTRRDLAGPLAESAFALAEGRWSEPVRSPLGWHILVVDKVEAGRTPTLDQAREEIAREVARDEAVNRLVKTANKLEDELAGGASLESAADRLGLKATAVGPIDARGRLRSGVPAANLPQHPKVLEFAFRTPQGQATQLQEVRGGGYFILRVDTVTPPALRPLDEVRAQAIQAWKDKQRDDLARARAEKLLERVKGGEPLAKIAAELGLQAKTSDALTRFAVEPNAQVPSALVAAMFKAREGEAMMTAYEGGYAIAKVTEVKPVAQTDPSAEAAQLERELTASVANDLITQYTRALRRSYPVTVNRASVDSIQ